MRSPPFLAAISLTTIACALTGIGAEPPTPAVSEPRATTAPSTTVPMEQPTVVAPTAADTAVPPDVSALPAPASARWEPVLDGLTQPLDLQHAGDERLFVVQQPGLVRVVEGGQLLDTAFLDIRARVVDDALERGLLGLAFDPDYGQNGFFYVNYTGRGGHTRISRFQVSEDPNRADAGSEQIVLAYDQPFRNHNGGGLAFGPDGYLYVGVGDGGSAGDPQGNGQDLGTVLGSLLRIDVQADASYGIPANNPFLGREGARAEIWAYGLRNPWRFSFDPATGDLYIADVGQNQWEEINFEHADSPGGVNYGWNQYEGRHPFTGGGEGTTFPVAEYNHSLGCSVTGGVVVRDPALPQWQGTYLYGDYCSGNVWGLLRLAEGTWTSELLFSTDFQVSAFGADARGRVYIVDLNGGLHRLVPAD